MPVMIDLQGTPVLVTGGSGFVGSHLAAGLAAAGARVSALVRRRGDHPGLDSPGILQVEGDFVDPATAERATAGAEIVVHAAAAIGADLAEARRVNVEGTAGLAAAARKAGCRHFFHISTLSVYDFGARREIFDETAPQKSEVRAYAHSPAATPYYGLSKAEAERALAAEMERGLPATIFRLAAVLGVHPTSSWAVLVPAKVRAGEVPLAGDGGDPLPWTHVDNVRHALLLALASEKEPEKEPEKENAAVGRAYNLVDGEVTWRRYVEDVRAWFPDARPAPVVARDQPAFLGHCPADRIRQELGYAPVQSYEAGMAEAAAWWQARL
jgi:nucleoside-diphosphate-sugar epimerase